MERRLEAIRNKSVSNLVLPRTSGRKRYLATPPRAANRQHHGPLVTLFMTTSRMGKKSLGGRGFGKKSARLSTLRTKGT
eukprot:6214299-Pleurochrysis_carterae.AAC.4